MAKNFVVLFVVLAVIFIIGQSRWLAVKGINPNLLFVFFLLLAFNAGNFLLLFVLALSLRLFVFFFSPAWLLPAGLLSLLVLGFYFLKSVLTGTAFLDFLVLVLAGTVLFYFILEIFRLPALPLAQISWEALYNLILGAVLWSALSEKIKL